MIGKRIVRLTSNEADWSVRGYATSELVERRTNGNNIYKIGLWGAMTRTGVSFRVEDNNAFHILVHDVVPIGFRPTVLNNVAVRANLLTWPSFNDNPPGTPQKAWAYNVADTGDIWFKPLRDTQAAGVIEQSDTFGIGTSYTCEQAYTKKGYKYRLEGKLWL